MSDDLPREGLEAAVEAIALQIAEDEWTSAYDPVVAHPADIRRARRYLEAALPHLPGVRLNEAECEVALHCIMGRRWEGELAERHDFQRALGDKLEAELARLREGGEGG